jgi:hypothetical protein
MTGNRLILRLSPEGSPTTIPAPIFACAAEIVQSTAVQIKAKRMRDLKKRPFVKVLKKKRLRSFLFLNYLKLRH